MDGSAKRAGRPKIGGNEDLEDDVVCGRERSHGCCLLFARLRSAIDRTMGECIAAPLG